MNSNSANSVFCTRRQQRGAVMVVSLIFLVIITLLAVSALQTSNLEVLMAANTQSRATALATAENALVDGELMVVAETDPLPNSDWADDVNADGTLMTAYDFRYVVDPDIVFTATVDDIDWIAEPTGTDPPVGYAFAPSGGKFTVEYMGAFTTLGESAAQGTGEDPANRYLYRITGRGEFGSGGTRFTQSVYATME